MRPVMGHDDILRAALSLPDADRADIADKLLLSLDLSDQREIDALWAQVAESRIEEYEQGQLEAVPGNEVFARIRASHQR